MGSDDLFKKRKLKKQDLERKSAKRAPHETVLMVSEGEKSEVNYLCGFRKRHRLSTTHVKIYPSVQGSAPSNVVDYAIELAERESGIDKVFCILDRDTHATLKPALDKLRSRKAKNKPIYEGILSTPCFEFWLFLHFEYTTKSYERVGKYSACEMLIKDLKKYIPNYAKNKANLFELLETHTQGAIARAQKLKEHNNETGSDNPSTDMHELIEYLQSLAKK